MDTRDRAFIHELTQFIHKNHIVSTYIYRTRLNSLQGLEDIAVFAGDQLRNYSSPEVAIEDIRAHGEAKAIERIICAKIFAEFVSACEDLGALGDAIRYRGTNGIFMRHLSSSVGQAASFFDNCVLPYDVLNDSTITLGTLLDLPDIAVLANKFSAEDYPLIQQSFRSAAINLYAAATMYREKAGAQVMATAGNIPVSTHADEMYILLDVKPTGSAITQKGGIHARALNKIKHRFMVIDQLKDYALPGASETIEYAVLKPEMIDRFFESTIAVSGTIAEIAAFVYHLDTAGITF